MDSRNLPPGREFDSPILRACTLLRTLVCWLVFCALLAGWANAQFILPVLPIAY